MIYSNFDTLHLDSLAHVMSEGAPIENDRTGVGTRKVFAHQELFNASNGNFPLLTVRPTSPRIAFWELMWMLRGDTDVKFLQDKDIHIWDGNSTKEYLANYGKLGKVEPNTIGKGYGYQFRNFNGVDQLRNVYESLKHDPYGRRHMINLWNPADFDEMALHPCHYCYTFDVDPSHMTNGRDILNLHQHIRSNDAVLGSPYNKMFAVFFLNFMAQALGYDVGIVATSITNFHIYNTHMSAVNRMMEVKDLERFKGNRSPFRIKLKENFSTLDEMLELTEDSYEIIPRERYSEPLLRFKKSDLPMAV